MFVVFGAAESDVADDNAAERLIELVLVLIVFDDV